MFTQTPGNQLPTARQLLWRPFYGASPHDATVGKKTSTRHVQVPSVIRGRYIYNRMIGPTFAKMLGDRLMQLVADFRLEDTDTRIHVDNVEVLSKETPYCLHRPNTVNCNYLKAILRVNITGARTFNAFREELSRRVVSNHEPAEEELGHIDIPSPRSSVPSDEPYYDDDYDDPEMWRALYESRGGSD